jgi:hypothetical protein
MPLNVLANPKGGVGKSTPATSVEGREPIQDLLSYAGGDCAVTVWEATSAVG